ncbi:MAG: tRNA (guanine(46)-N(7))-methyltransferase TrmB [Nocardioidaceae bacterium]
MVIEGVSSAVGPDERAARPHTMFTPQGRRIRDVVSYARRGSRMTDERRSVWSRNADRWWIPDAAVDDKRFELPARFGRAAPLVVEIGSGIGEATVALAAARPDVNVLAFEVWRAGIAETMLRLEANHCDNVRLVSVDAVWSLEHLLGPGSVTELWTFFPDPWPKSKHHKRRLVGSAFARTVASRLAAGGRWRLATDWPEYAASMVRVLGAEPLLAGGVTPRWHERPMTRFERRGLRAGRPVTDLTYRRVVPDELGRTVPPSRDSF